MSFSILEKFKYWLIVNFITMIVFLYFSSFSWRLNLKDPSTSAGAGEIIFFVIIALPCMWVAIAVNFIWLIRNLYLFLIDKKKIRFLIMSCIIILWILIYKFSVMAMMQNLGHPLIDSLKWVRQGSHDSATRGHRLLKNRSHF